MTGDAELQQRMAGGAGVGFFPTVEFRVNPYIQTAVRHAILFPVKSKNLKRDRAIAARVLGGESYTKVAAEVGLSAYRCREVVMGYCIRADRLLFVEAILASRERVGGRVCCPRLNQLRERRGAFRLGEKGE